MTTEQKIDQCKSINWYALTNDQLNHILEIAGMPVSPQRQYVDAFESSHRKCLVFECDKPEDVPGFCAEHAAMVNAECDRLDNLRNAGQVTDKPA